MSELGHLLLERALAAEEARDIAEAQVAKLKQQLEAALEGAPEERRNLAVEAAVASFAQRCGTAEALLLDAEALSKTITVASPEWSEWRTRALAHIEAAKIADGTSKTAQDSTFVRARAALQNTQSFKLAAQVNHFVDNNGKWVMGEGFSGALSSLNTQSLGTEGQLAKVIKGWQQQ